MAFSFRKLSKRFFVLINLFVSALFLLPCLQPWLNARRYWFIDVLNIASPYMLILVVAFVFFWMIANFRYMLIPLITLGLGWKQVEVLFSFDSADFVMEKKAGNLRLMTWNIKAFQGVEGLNSEKKGNAANIFNLIETVSPDLVCFQEFGQYDSPRVGRNYIEEMRKIGFEYSVQSKDYIRSKPWGYSSGLAIFSKTPFVRTSRMPFTSNPESVLYADVVHGTDTVRLFTTHLQSYKFSGNDYRDIEKIKNNDDSLYKASLNIFGKMKRAIRNRASQADMIRPLLDSCPYPEIMTCDMNDVPGSYAYWQLRGQRRDAFLEKGFGVGRSFIALAPTLRIDYILPDQRFTVTQFDIGSKRYSDHLPLIADLELHTR